MRCLNCTARVLRVFIHGSNPSLPISRIAALHRAPPRALPLLQQSIRHHYTSTQSRYSEDEDYIPMATSTVESTREWQHLAGTPPPPPRAPERPRDDHPAPKVLRETRTSPSTRPIAAHSPTTAPTLDRSSPHPKKTRESAEAREPRKPKTREPRDPEERKLRAASLAPATDAAWRDYIAEKESRPTLQPTESQKKDAWAKKKAKDAAEKEERLARRAAREAAAAKPAKPPTKSRKTWNLPVLDAPAPLVDRLAAHIAANPKTAEDWKIAKLAVKRKLGSETWRPEKRLSPDAMDGIRTLNAQHPEEYNMATLPALFGVSPEAIRRILSNQWMPNQDEIKERSRRWAGRKEEIWKHWLETGEVVNKSEKRRLQKEEKRKVVGGGDAEGKEWREGLEKGMRERRRTDGRREHAKMVREMSGPFTDLSGRLDV